MRSVAIFFILASANFALGQDNSKARNDAYSRCAAVARDSEVKYKACKDYLDNYADDFQQRETAHKFVVAYERVTAYAKALQAFALSQKNTWFVYEPDLKIDQPNVDQRQGNYTIKIERSVESTAQAAMLKKAEAVYGPQTHYLDAMRQSPESWAEDLPDEILMPP